MGVNITFVSRLSARYDEADLLVVHGNAEFLEETLVRPQPTEVRLTFHFFLRLVLNEPSKVAPHQ